MYLKRAKSMMEVSKLLFSPQGNPTNDEDKTMLGLFLAQQGIELELKHILHDLYGEDDTKKRFKSHNIFSLIRYVEEVSGIVLPDELKEMAEDITSWEQTARYPGIAMKNAREDAERVFKIFDQVLELIDEN